MFSLGGCVFCLSLIRILFLDLFLLLISKPIITFIYSSYDRFAIYMHDKRMFRLTELINIIILIKIRHVFGTLLHWILYKIWTKLFIKIQKHHLYSWTLTQDSVYTLFMTHIHTEHRAVAVSFGKISTTTLRAL